MFWEGRVAFFTANIGHHSDIGGPCPDPSRAVALDLPRRGLRLPVIRIVRTASSSRICCNLIASDTRDPRSARSICGVQIATNERGAQGARGLVRQMGLGRCGRRSRSVSRIRAAGWRRVGGRNRIGEYTFTNHLDDDGMGGDPVPIAVTVRVAGERLAADFSGIGNPRRAAR